MSKPSLVVATGDWHVNDTKGLCPPIFHRENLSQHRPGPAIRGRWRDWLTFWKGIAEIKQTYGAIVYAHCVGDLGDNNKHSKAQLISPLKPDILRAMVDVSQPMLEVADFIIVERGTEAHSDSVGELEESFANDIDVDSVSYKVIHDDESGDASWDYFAGSHGGVTMDIQHHPPTGTRITSKVSQAVARACERVAGRYYKIGAQPPQVCVWAHTHIGGEGGPEMGVKGYFLPPWKLVGAFGHRLGAGGAVEPSGGLWMLCHEGKIVDSDLVRFIIRPRKRWRDE